MPPETLEVSYKNQFYNNQEHNIVLYTLIHLSDTCNY